MTTYEPLDRSPATLFDDEATAAAPRISPTGSWRPRLACGLDPLGAPDSARQAAAAHACEGEPGRRPGRRAWLIVAIALVLVAGVAVAGVPLAKLPARVAGDLRPGRIADHAGDNPTSVRMAAS